MLTAFRRSWRELRRGRPGHRFQDRYASAKRERKRTPAWRRIARFGLALVLFAAAVVFVFIPGPAILFFALSGALLATESRPIARALDWIELRGRAIGRGVRKRWARLGLAARAGVIGLSSAVAAGMAFLAWSFIAA
ncbi:MAG TPA: hypothetical protein VG838_00760 [Opitutaceae bacterium]|nr:hypothetical protein [Opitutaceae bacterium]